jgi:cytidylate kinase
VLAGKIALSGRSGSGKTTVADYLVSKYGYSPCSTGSACRDLCRNLFGSESKAILNQVTDALKAIDPDVWLRAALLSFEEGKPAVFDSMRFANDYAYLQIRGFQMWRVEAPLKIRLARMQRRGQVVSLQDDDHPAERELDTYRFDQVLDNTEDGLEALYTRIEEALN